MKSCRLIYFASYQDFVSNFATSKKMRYQVMGKNLFYACRNPFNPLTTPNNGKRSREQLLKQLTHSRTELSWQSPLYKGVNNNMLDIEAIWLRCEQ